VEYDPSTTTISCVFENESDLSKKTCSIEYGMCDKEINYFVQNSSTEGSPSTVTLELSTNTTNSRNCYVVTASNDALTVLVKGSFETQSSSNNSNSNVGVIVGIVIGVIIILFGLVAGIVIVIIAYSRRKCGMLNL
jgi:hypothetical protein